MSAKRRLVVIGNGMAGARLVEEVLARGGRDRFDDHGLRRRAVRQLQPHPALERARAELRSEEHLHQPAAVVRSQRRDAPRRRARQADRSRGETGARRARHDRGVRRPRHRHRQQAVHPADRRRDVRPSPSRRGTGAASFKRGVFVFRTLDDCDRMLTFMSRVSRAAVIGGGLLGLEAARGLLERRARRPRRPPHAAPDGRTARRGRRPWCCESSSSRWGSRSISRRRRPRCWATTEVTGLRFADGSTLDCEMVVIAAGIRPNVELAVRSGLPVVRGIVVGDDLACDGAPGVYAIGECAEHRGRVYGLVAPRGNRRRCSPSA